MKIGIVGAGPAGLICAWQLAEAGHNVVIFEKRKELGAQGSGVLIQPVGLRALDYLGIRAQVEKHGQRVKRIRGYAGFDKSRKVIDANYGLLNGEFNYSLGINRSELWKILFQKARESGVTIQYGARIESLSYHSATTVELIGDDQQTIGVFDLIVDASGANSKLIRFAEGLGQQHLLDYGSLWTRVTMPKECLFDAEEMQVFTGDKNKGLGLMPTGGQECTLFLTVDDYGGLPWEKVGFDCWRSDLVKKWPLFEHVLLQIQSAKQLYAARFNHHTLFKPYGQRIVYVGDAAHCSSPQLGQGINMSIVDAVVLCRALTQKNDVDDALKFYAKARKSHVLAYQYLARLLTPFYHSRDVIAIFARDHYFYLVFKISVFKRITATVLSGNIFNPLKTVLSKTNSDKS